MPCFMRLGPWTVALLIMYIASMYMCHQNYILDILAVGLKYWQCPA